MFSLFNNWSKTLYNKNLSLPAFCSSRHLLLSWSVWPSSTPTNFHVCIKQIQIAWEKISCCCWDSVPRSRVVKSTGPKIWFPDTVLIGCTYYSWQVCTNHISTINSLINSISGTVSCFIEGLPNRLGELCFLWNFSSYKWIKSF